MVCAPSYLADRPLPKTPADLTGHRCINVRMPTKGGLYISESEKDGRALNVRVDGPLILNDMRLVLQAASEGLGIAFAVED